MDSQKMEDKAGRRSMMKARRIFILMLILAVCIAYYAKAGSFKKVEPLAAGYLAKEMADTKSDKMQTFTIFGFSETGKKKWEVHGKSADIMADTINLSDINADAYSEDAAVNLTADKGVFDRRSNDIELNDNVIALTTEGTRLTTQKLYWRAKLGLIDTDDYVHIERKDMEVDGKGATASPTLKTAKLVKDVKVSVKPSTIITCDGPLEIDYKNSVSYFNNNVRLDDGKAQIFADKATAFFSPKQRVITKVISEGNVKIIKGENVTYAQQLTYLPDEGKVILTGRPQIVINSTDELMEGMKK